MSDEGKALDRLSLLYDVGRALATKVHLDELLQDIVVAAATVMQARASSLLLVDAATRELVFEVVHGEKSGLLKGVRVPIDDQSVAGRVARTGESLLVDDVRTVTFFSGQVDQVTNFQTHSVLCVPLRGQTGLIGVIEVLNKVSGQRFGKDDVALLTALAGTAAVAIENARLYEETARRASQLVSLVSELQRTYQATLRVLTALLDARDAPTRGHSQRVVHFTLALAHAVGVTDADQLKVLEYGALLHDVGKIGVPDAILHKPGPLTADEWLQMRKHPDIGYTVLKDIDFLGEAMPIILYHHERWDGSGYPQGLAGEAIPLAARIFAIADAFDALSTDRPYQDAVSYEEAAQRIRAGRGTQFDPRVVDAFLSIPAAEWQRLQELVATQT